MILDIRTILFIYLLTNIICSFVILLLWRQGRGRFDGLNFLALGVAAHTLAFFLILLRGSIPDWTSIVLANALILMGALLGYIGLSRFVGVKSAQAQNYVLLAAMVFVHSYFTFKQPDLAARTINLHVCLLISPS